MPTKEEVLDNLNEEKEIFLTGGEPTISPFFEEIVLELKKRNYYINLQTNGSFADDKSKVGFILSNIDFIILPIYGIDKETVEKITRTKKSFENSVALVNCIAKAKSITSKISSITVINSLNINSLPEIVDYVNSNKFVMHNLVFIHMIGECKKNFDKVVSYSDVCESLLKCKLTAKDKINSIPKCMLEKYGLEEYFGDNYPDNSFLDKRVTIKSESYWHQKYDFCENCKTKNRCPGVPERYADIFGIKEFL